MSTFTDVINRVPPGVIGKAKLVHDEPDELTRLRAAMHGQPLDSKKYARLFVGNRLVMTDADFEKRTNGEVVWRAKGDALIAGLGIGLILDPLLKKCTSVRVIEKEADVIALIGPHFPKAQIVHADIFDYTPQRGSKFDTIYFDIWPDICSDDLTEATKLHRKFKNYLRPGGWMRSWTRTANQAMGRR